MKNICLLGASGSIGTQSLEVLKEHEEIFNLVAISVGKNLKAAREIIKQFPSIKYLVIQEEKDLDQFSDLTITVLAGSDGLNYIASLDEVDYVINALIGFIGLKPTINAIKAGKTIGLANKETLVCAGDIIMDLAKKHKVLILPIDSEHSAIFQAIANNHPDDIKRIILTASGGSFRDLSLTQLQNVTVQDALKHPTWNMGAGITIDSATMFNKALEIIEAHHLFNIDYTKIDVLMHPQSLNHSMVEYIDGSCIAQISFPNMKIPIAYALSYPRRIHISGIKDIITLEHMDYQTIDENRFKAIKIAYAVGQQGGSYPTVLNASKEIANKLFLEEKIKFLDIEKIIIQALKDHNYVKNPTIDEIIKIDKQTREEILKNLERMN